MQYIYEDLTHEIIGYLFDVHNTLGIGYDEPAYHNGLIRRFSKTGIEFKSKERRPLIHRGNEVRKIEADFLVFDNIILELKAIQSKFIRANYVQLNSELKLWEKQIGLLVNFGLQKVEIERIPFTEKPKSITENYDYIKNQINEEDKHCLTELRKAILHVFEIHGLGFGDSVYRKLLETELDFRRISWQRKVPIEVKFENEPVSVFKMKSLLVENRIICDIKALVDEIDFYDIAKIQSYLKALNLQIGVIVNFGKKALEIRGVHA